MNIIKKTMSLVILLIGLQFATATGAISAQSFQGYVEGDYLFIGLRDGGVVKSLSVEKGDEVQLGGQLFTLDNAREVAVLKGAMSQLERAKATLSDLEKGLRDSEISAILARLEQAVSQQDLAELTLNRQLQLQGRGAASQQNLDTAQATFDLAKSRITELQSDLVTARLGARDDVLLSQLAEVEGLRAKVDEAQWAVDQRIATAPKAGIIEDVFYRQGEFLPQGRPGISLLPPENIKIRFYVSERDFSSIKHGQKVSVTCDSCPQSYQATVSFISSKAEFTPPVIYSEDVREKLVFLIEARFTNAQLRPGQPVSVVLANE